MNRQTESQLDTIHHVAVEVSDVIASLEWYAQTFKCRVAYHEKTWALISFANMSLALVTRGQHPPHIGRVTEQAHDYGELTTHRDGTRSIYISDPAGNSVELLNTDCITTPMDSER